MTAPDTDPDDLLRRAAEGDAQARDQLLTHYRERLRQMVSLRMDRRLVSRIDPSDVVQEAMLDACQQLSDYLTQQPLPFYPWLRQLAFNRLLDLHRRHVLAQRRTVNREEGQTPVLPDDSLLELAARFQASGTSPSNQVVRAEMCQRVQQALTDLGERDREILVLRYLEKLSTGEIAAVLGITEGAVKVRHLRALRRIRELLQDPLSNQSS